MYTHQVIQSYRRLPESVRVKVREVLVPDSPEEIHIECLPHTFEKTLKWLRKRPQVRIMLLFSPYVPFTKELADYYTQLIETLPNPTGLHIHFCDDLRLGTPAGALPSKYQQEQSIVSALHKIRGLGMEKPTDFVSGQWQYNRDTLMACRYWGLTRIHVKIKYVPSLTKTWGVPKGVELIPVLRNIHDYDL